MFKDRREYVTCYTGAIKGNKLYVVHEGLDLLMEYDLRDYSYKVLANINPDEDKRRTRVRGIAILENVIYIAFECSWDILEYHMDTGKIRVNGMKKNCIEDMYAVECTYICQNEIWMFPCCINEKIRVFNTKTRIFSLKKSIGEYLKENGYYVEETCFGDYATSGNGIVYTITYESHFIIAIDMKSNKYKVFDMGEDKKIARIIYDGNGYWLSFSDSGMIVKWSPVNGIEKQYMINDVLIDERGLPIHYMYDGKESLFIILSYMQRIILLNKMSGKITYIDYPDDYKRINTNIRRYQFYEELIYKNYIIALPFSVNKLLQYNIESGEIKFFETKLCKEDIEKYILQDELKNKVITELDGYGVKEFIEYVEKEN